MKQLWRLFERGGYISDYLYYYTLMKLTQQYSSFQSDFEKAERFSVKAEEYVRKNHLSNAKRYGSLFCDLAICTGASINMRNHWNT